MARYEVTFSEMAWWLDDSEAEPGYGRTMLGNYRDMELLRDGHEVLITSETIGCPKSIIIPADTTISGFGRERNGKSFYDLTDSGTIYNCVLRAIGQQGGLKPPRA